MGVESGQAAAEYAMILGTIVIVLVAAFVVTPTLSSPIGALPGRIIALMLGS